MRYHAFLFAPLATCLFIVLPLPWQPRDGPNCHATIVSETVITTLCGHAAGAQQALDLLIMWRGSPGWFQRREKGASDDDVTREFANSEGTRVAQYRTFAEVTVGFDADFAARTVTIDGETLSLTHDNAIVVDHVDIPHMRRVVTTYRVETILPLSDDANLILARMSARVRAAFQCTPHLPSPRRGPLSPVQQRHVATVCERLRY